MTLTTRQNVDVSIRIKYMMFYLTHYQFLFSLFDSIQRIISRTQKACGSVDNFVIIMSVRLTDRQFFS